jgi:hypothetical protein
MVSGFFMILRCSCGSLKIVPETPLATRAPVNEFAFLLKSRSAQIKHFQRVAEDFS